MGRQHTAEGSQAPIAIKLRMGQTAPGKISCSTLSENPLDHLRAFDAGEFRVEALKFHAERVVPDAELVQHRRVEIVDGADVSVAV